MTDEESLLPFAQSQVKRERLFTLFTMLGLLFFIIGVAYDNDNDIFTPTWKQLAGYAMFGYASIAGQLMFFIGIYANILNSLP